MEPDRRVAAGGAIFDNSLVAHRQNQETGMVAPYHSQVPRYPMQFSAQQHAGQEVSARNVVGNPPYHLVSQQQPLSSAVGQHTHPLGSYQKPAEVEPAAQSTSAPQQPFSSSPWDGTNQYPPVHMQGPGGYYSQPSGPQNSQENVARQADTVSGAVHDNARASPSPGKSPQPLTLDTRTKEMYEPTTLTKTANTRIDSTCVPRPLMPSEPPTRVGGKVYESTKTTPPPPTGIFSVVDSNNASCRYVRSSLNLVPSYPLLSTSIPFNLRCEPFPALQRSEEKPALVSFLELPGCEGQQLPRCPNKRCMAYANGQMRIVGSSATCNLCGEEWHLPTFYSQAIHYHDRTVQSRSQNADERYIRYELSRGTIDLLIQDSPPQIVEGNMFGFSHVFCLETTFAALQSGITFGVIHSLKQLVQALTAETPFLVALLTFDSTITYWSCGENKMKCRILSDIDEPFAPAPAKDLMFLLPRDKSELEEALAYIDSHYRQVLASRTSQDGHGMPQGTSDGYQSWLTSPSCGVSAVASAADLLMHRNNQIRRRGGIITLFAATMPSLGVGKLDRTKAAISPNTTEKALFSIPDDLEEHYTALITQCVTEGLSVDIFLASARNVHLGITPLCLLTAQTGGQLQYFPNFDIQRDFETIYYRLYQHLTREFALDCSVRLRCSKGLSVKRCLVPWSLDLSNSGHNPSAFRIPRLDSDVGIDFEIKHDQEIEYQKRVFFQLAVLYTDRFARRLTRVITLGLDVTSSLSQTFRYADVYSTTAFMTRTFALATINGQIVRAEIEKAVVDILYSYRVNCAQNSSSEQLILPDSLKFLALYILGFCKSAAMRQVRDVRSDERIALILTLMRCSLKHLLIYLVPRLHPLYRSEQSLDRYKDEHLDRIGVYSGVGEYVYLPANLPSSGNFVTSDGIFLLETGAELLVYIGSTVGPDVIQQAFVGAPTAVTEQNTAVMRFNEQTDLGGRLCRVVEGIRQRSMPMPYPPLRFVAPKTLDESHFIWHLVEDRLGSEPGYVDMLCDLHKKVTKRMESR